MATDTYPTKMASVRRAKAGLTPEGAVPPHPCKRQVRLGESKAATESGQRSLALGSESEKLELDQNR